jgi:hypothetical protein
MKRMLALAPVAAMCALVVVLVMGAQARAEPTRRITVRIGDAFLVSGTDLACQTEVGKNVIRGKKLVTCFKVKGRILAPGSYIAALGENGRVVVAPIKANGNPGTPVFDRTPAALGSAARQFTARPGDELRLAGTKIACGVNNDVSGVYPTCFRTTSTGGVPGSYAFAVTERFAAVVRFDSTGRKTKPVFRRVHGR